MDEIQYGIYIGVNFSCIAVNGKIIENKRGKNEILVPTIISYQKNIKEPVIGMNNSSQSDENPENTIYGFHQLIGKKFSDPKVQEFKQTVKYKIEKKNENDEIKIVINHNNVLIEKSPEYFLKILIEKLLKFDNNQYNNSTVFSYFLTIPADFDENQKQLIRNEIKELKINIIPEPNALIFSYEKNSIYNDIIFVLSNDKKEIDISLLNCGKLMKNKKYIFNEECFIEKLLSYCIKSYAKIIDSKYFKEAQKSKLKEKLNDCLKTLIQTPIFEINIPNFYKKQRFNIEITRSDLTKICKEEYDNIIEFIKQLFQELYLNISQINQFVFNCNNIPNIHEYFSSSFNTIEKNSIIELNGQYENFAKGASLYQVEDDDGGIINIGDDDYNDDNLDSINQEKIHQESPIKLSLGFDKGDGRMDFIIKKGEKKNFKQIIYYETKYDYQDTFYIKLYRGERKFVEDNYCLAIYELNNLKRKKKGKIIIIEVEFVPSNDKLMIIIYEKDNPYNKKTFNKFPYNIPFTKNEQLLLNNPKKYEKEDEKKTNAMHMIKQIKDEIIQYDDILDFHEKNKPELIKEIKDSMNEIFTLINYKNYEEFKKKFDNNKLIIEELLKKSSNNQLEKELKDKEQENKELKRQVNQLNRRTEVLQKTIKDIKIREIEREENIN